MRNKTNLIGILGLVLALAGFFVWAIRSVLDPWSLTPLALGILLILAYVFSNFNDLVAKMSGRSAREGLNSLIMVVVTLAIICFLQVILTRHSKRVDTTRSGKYSLAPQTVQILENLKDPVTITYLWNPQIPSDRERAADLLEEFRHYSDKVNYAFVDPVKDLTKVERFTVGGNVSLNSAYVECGTKREKVDGVEEGDFTNALIKVTREQDKVVYFLTQHGEKGWDDAAGLNGLGYLKQGLEEEAYTAKDLVLAELTEVPDDAALLVIAGPQTELFENETLAIRDYLKYGGSLLLMEDPRTESGLEPLLRDSYGITIRKDIILDNDPIYRLMGQTNFSLTVRAASYGYHDCTKNVDRIATVYSIARSLEKSAAMPSGVRGTDLVKTSEDSFGETNVEQLFKEQTAQKDPDVDSVGPLVLAIAVDWDADKRISDATDEVSTEPKSEFENEEKPLGRMVVVGDSDFATNQFYRTNKDFVMNCVNWLCQESDLISIRPKEDLGEPIFLTAMQARLVFWVPVVILPLLVLVLGTMIFINRRVRG
ncbi:MAG: GldG family protein [bacterium]